MAFSSSNRTPNSQRSGFSGWGSHPGRGFSRGGVPPAGNKGAVGRTSWKDLDYRLLAVTAVTGIVLWILSVLLYDASSGSVSRPALIGLLFMLLGLGLPLAALICSRVTGTYEENLISHTDDMIAPLLTLVASVVLVLGAGALLQWIYGLTLNSTQSATSYVFVIDDSGSMQENDESQNRFKAIPTVLAGSGRNIPYMVYRFADGVEVVRPMAPASDGDEPLSGKGEGKTAIFGALTQVMNDYLNGLWAGGGAPKVILLTDGGATDGESADANENLLRKYVQKGISISAVGLGNYDRTLMEHICSATGGVCVDVSSVAQLDAAMAAAARSYAQQDLLSVRHSSRLGFLYGVMRVLFLTILGTLISAAVALMFGVTDSVLFTTLSGGVKTFVGALFFELFTSLFSITHMVMWAVLWLLISAALAESTQSSDRVKGSGRNLVKAGVRNSAAQSARRSGSGPFRRH